MEINSVYVKNLIMFKKEEDLIQLFHTGWDPNYEGGWPIRLAARYGCYSIVEAFIRYGANPHLPSESGASTLQLAVYSGEHWETNKWSFLLSCCDSSQLADGAAVAIVFSNGEALQRILETGRCNINIATTLTGKTLEQLAKGYKQMHLLGTSSTLRIPSPDRRNTSLSPRTTRCHRLDTRNTPTQQPQRNLSPSVARFFQLTVTQSALISPRTQTTPSSPILH